MWPFLYPWVMYLLTIRIIEAFGLPKLSLFSQYKVMLLVCHHRANWIQIQVMCYLSSCWLIVTNHVMLLHNIWSGTYFTEEILCHITVIQQLSHSIDCCIPITWQRYKATFTLMCDYDLVNDLQPHRRLTC